MLPAITRIPVQVGLGILLGEAFLIIGALDIVRGRVMADATGSEALGTLCPLGVVMGYVSFPVFEASERLRGQDPLAMLLLLVPYWAVVGVLALLLSRAGWTIVRRMRGLPRERSRRGRRRQLPAQDSVVRDE